MQKLAANKQKGHERNLQDFKDKSSSSYATAVAAHEWDPVMQLAREILDGTRLVLVGVSAFPAPQQQQKGQCDLPDCLPITIEYKVEYRAPSPSALTTTSC